MNYHIVTTHVYSRLTPDLISSIQIPSFRMFKKLVFSMTITLIQDIDILSK